LRAATSAICFFLGILFANFPYDYYVLWASPTAVTTPSSLAIPSTRAAYLDVLESHLRFLHASPPLINRILHIVIGTGLIGLLTKLYKPSEANMLFDGASLVLYMCGITVYIANIVKGLRVVSSGVYSEGGAAAAQGEATLAEGLGIGGIGGSKEIGREDSLRVFAASNTILALVLMGVLVLQAGQWYAMKKETAEIEEMDRVAEEKRERRKDGKGSHSGQVSGEKARSPVGEKKRL